MEKQLSKILTSHNGLVAAVGPNISPIKRDNYPCVTYEKTSGSQEIDMSGAPRGPKQTTYNITVRTKSYKSSKDIAELVVEAITPPFNYITDKKIYLAVLENETEEQLFEPDITEVILEYTFYHD
uniref:hypothetical protein n=1 Tax=Ningiella ruwaisensis TaxID=2364274 RepID=UPI00109F468A|nr:hypothetical protein [Ningiella ruwaisensis]